MAASPFLAPVTPLRSESSYMPIPTVDSADAGNAMVDAETDAPDPLSCWGFVEKGWFQAITACVISMNVVTIMKECDDPSHATELFWLDSLILCFYIMELISRSAYYGANFINARTQGMFWNVLDIFVVAAGVTDQWLLSLLPVQPRGKVNTVLTVLRFGRLFRALKIMRLFFQSDLSWAESARFQSFIGFVIIINALVMGAEIDYQSSEWVYIEQVFLCIYVFEISVRLRYHMNIFFSFSNPDFTWNILDFVIVASSVIDSWFVPLARLVARSFGPNSMNGNHSLGNMSLYQIMMLLRMVRLMRILRLVKLVHAVRPLYVLVTGVLAAVQGVAWVLVLTVIVLYAGGILSTSLIGKGYLFSPDADLPVEILHPFESVPMSMFTLFRIMSGATSTEQEAAMDALMQDRPAFRFAFVFFMITTSWTLLSILTAVVSENMISTTEEQHQEMKLAAFEDDRAQHVQHLKDLFSEIESSGDFDGKVDAVAIDKFLADQKNAHRTARHCRVPARSVKEVLSTVNYGLDTDVIDMNNFVEALVDVGQPVTEKSVMRLEARLHCIQESLDDFLLTSEQKAQIETKRKLRSSAFARTRSNLDHGMESTSTSGLQSAQAQCQLPCQIDASSKPSLNENFDTLTSKSSLEILLNEIQNQFRSLKLDIRKSVAEEISSQFLILAEACRHITPTNWANKVGTRVHNAEKQNLAHASPELDEQTGQGKLIGGSIEVLTAENIRASNETSLQDESLQIDVSARDMTGAPITGDTLHKLMLEIKALIVNASADAVRPFQDCKKEQHQKCTVVAQEASRFEVQNQTSLHFSQESFEVDVPETMWFLPKMLDGVPVLIHEHGNVYRVDRSSFKGNVDGINYCKSKDFRDCGHTTRAPWGSIVEGIDEGDGWIRLVEGARVSNS